MCRSALALCVVLVLSVALPARAEAASVVQTWDVGVEPFGVTIDPRDGKVYVAITDHYNYTGAPEDMWVIDPALPYGSTITLPSPQVMSVLDPTLDRLFVTAGALTIIDTNTHAILGAIPNVGVLGVALDPATHHVFSSSLGGLALVDGATATVLATRSAPSGDAWWAVAHDPLRHRVYVTNLNYNAPSVVVLDDATLAVVGTVALPAVPRLALAVDVERGLVYVGGYSSATDPFGRLYAIDESSLQIVRTLDVGFGLGSPISFTLAPATSTLYVSDVAGDPSGRGNALVVVDLSTFSVTQRNDLPFQPGQSALHPDGRLYVASFTQQLVALTLGNNAPVVDSVSVTPVSPKTNDLVTAVVTAHDPDGDPITLSYRWHRNGVLLAGETGATLDLSKPGNGDRGDQISVHVNASDGTLVSADTLTSGWAFWVADTAPTVTVSLNATSPLTNDTLVATTAGADVDADALSYTYTWKVNGVVRRTIRSASATDSFDLSLAGHGDRGDLVTVEVVASDGELTSPAASAGVTVVNAAPTITATLNDTKPRKQDVLIATAIAFDADADVLTFTYTWRVNAKVKQVTTGTTATSSFDLRAAEAEIGDAVTVEVIVSDGVGQALATASATVTPAGR